MARGGLQREIKKRRPFDCPEQEAALNLLRTADRLDSAFDRLFRRHGMSGPQYNVLRILRGAGGDGLPSREVGARMITAGPDVTRLVDRLEAAGLVARDRSASDRRVILVRPTPEGLARLASLDAPVLDLHRRLLGHLSRDELATLNALLVKAREPEPSACVSNPQATPESPR